MTDRGKPLPPDSSGGDDPKPSWRRSGGAPKPPPLPGEARKPAAPEVPAVPAGPDVPDVPEDLDEPELEDRTLIHIPEGVLEPAPATSQPESGNSTAVLPSGLPKIPGLTLTREIGRGGMGVVYEGKQGYLDRRVAVKLLAQGSQTEEFMLRFQREAKILASLSHRHVVSCYQAGIAPDGRCYLAMEYIDGPTLADWIQVHGPLPDDRAIELCRDVASALRHAHRAGIIHRDVKPANVLLKTAQGKGPDDPFPYEPMLADLGLARPSGELPTLVDITSKGLTVQGAVMGSPPTMAPEQFDNPDEVDFRTDIYGLGCILFHCLTGKLAFPQATLTRLIARKTDTKPPDPRELRKDLSSDLAALVCWMLAPKREDRPASYDELLKRLEGPFLPSRPSGHRALILGAAAVLVLAGGWFARGALFGGGGSPEDEDTARRTDEPGDAPIEDEGPGGHATEPPDDGSRGPGGADVSPPLDVDRTSDHTSGKGDESTGGDLGTGGQGGGDAAQLPDTTPDTTPGETPNDTPNETPDETPDTNPPVDDRGAGDAKEDEPADSHVEVPPVEIEPAIVLPQLEPIGTGDTWALLGDLIGKPPLDNWTTTVGERRAWSSLEDSRNGAEALLFDPDHPRSVAEHALPAPPWSLSGRMELVRPTRTITRALRLVLLLQNGRGIMLEQGVTEDEVRLVGSWARSREDGGWSADGDIPELSLGPVSRAAYKDAAPVTFEISWDGEVLAIAWSLAGAQAGGPRAELSKQELRDKGFPVGLGVELDSGAGILRDFVIRGR